MIQTFEPALLLLLHHEGGFVNDKHDRGGMTNLGVTSRAWADWLHEPVDEKEMRGLTLSQVRPFYRIKYWNACGANQLPAGVDYAVFDFSVNSGVGRAVRTLQDTLGVDIDGILGPETLAACEALSPATLITHYTTARLDYLERLDDWDIFGEGWQNRVNEVEGEALRFANAAITQPPAA